MMDRPIRRRPLLIAALGVVLPLLPAVAAAEQLADVYLKNGLALRGAVTVVDGDVVLTNAAGQVHVAAERVARVVPVRDEASAEPAAGPHSATAPAAQQGGATPAASRPGGVIGPGGAALPPPGHAAEPTSAPGHGEEAEGEGDAADADALPVPPPLSARDVQRLKLLELVMTGEPERVRVNFTRSGGQRDLAAEVLDELRPHPDFQPEWTGILTRGTPMEKLRLIVQETGAKYADRVEIEGDPELFALFRRRVLPLVESNCARSGCHTGRTARVFRFPTGSVSSDKYAYTAFVLLDQMQTRQGPLLNRQNPTESVLLSYLLPEEGNPRAHPPVGRGPKFRPGLRSTADPGYAATLDWISFLVSPHPNYGLNYANPYTGPLPGEAPQRGAERAGEGPPPAGEGGSEPPATTRPARAPTMAPPPPDGDPAP